MGPLEVSVKISEKPPSEPDLARQIAQGVRVGRAAARQAEAREHGSSGTEREEEAVEGRWVLEARPGTSGWCGLSGGKEAHTPICLQSLPWMTWT